jgi:hypothetical protein
LLTLIATKNADHQDCYGFTIGQHTILVKPSEATSFMQVSSVVLNKSSKLKKTHLKNQNIRLSERNRNRKDEEAEYKLTVMKTGDKVIKFSK